MESDTLFITIAKVACTLAFVVVVLGAYTRLSDAGLGCPDWPGCYGQISVPQTQAEIDPGSDLYASRPLEQGKAWKEMIHRYAAGSLGLLILVLAILALRRRHEPGQQVWIPLALVGLVVFQAALGMWTVTWLLHPQVVMGHLMGGMTILLLLYWTILKQTAQKRRQPRRRTPQTLYPLALIALLVVYLQISLGGWTGANYAALICPDFPMCQGQWWPEVNFGGGFALRHEVGVNYEYGILDGPSRTAIHLSHRIGALITTLLVGSLAILAILRGNPPVRRTGAVLLVLLLAQVGLGIGNIVLQLPMVVAVSHNGVGALLMLCTATLLFHTITETG